MFCNHCGRKNASASRFCTGCGAPLAESGPAGQYADFWRRAAAFLLDCALLYGILILGFSLFLLEKSRRLQPSECAVLLMPVIVLVASWLYWAAMESSGLRATLGKRAFGIIVTDLQGRRISFGKATVRHFGKLLSTMLFYLGFLMAAFTAKKQALHDILAGTLVVPRPAGPPMVTGFPVTPQDPVQPFYR